MRPSPRAGKAGNAAAAYITAGQATTLASLLKFFDFFYFINGAYLGAFHFFR